MNNPKLLIHTCCAPCLGYTYETLKEKYEITAFYFNPNISPVKEYQKRLIELKDFATRKKFELLEGEYQLKEWVQKIKPLSFYGEKSERCWLCYRIRLEETFKTAVKNNFDIVATALSISPHKNSKVLNEIGLELEKEYKIKYLVADFKKNDGFKNSTIYSKKEGFYRQNYCGCIYSKKEREKDSLWYQQFLNEQSKLKQKINQKP